jgi:TPR repeat protein
MLGKIGSCSIVASYESDRGNHEEAYKWYKKICDENPVAIGLCLAAVQEKIFSKDSDTATALYLKSCRKEFSEYCKLPGKNACQKTAEI